MELPFHAELAGLVGGGEQGAKSQGRGERALDSLGRLAGPGWCRHRAASRSTWPGEAHPPSLLQTGPQTLPVPPEPRWWGGDFLPAQLLNQVCS